MAVRKHSVIMTSPVRRNEPTVLAIVLLVALVLRLWGLGSAAPGRYQPQEEYFIAAALRLLTGEFAPASFVHPPLFSYLVAIADKAFELVVRLTALDGVLSSTKPIVSLDMFTIHLVGRVMSCAFGVAGVFATYLVGRSAYGEVTGLIGAGLLAINFSHVRESHFATPTTTFVFFLLLALIAALKIADRGDRRSYAQFGVFAALACSTNHSGMLLVAPYLLAHLSFAFRKGGATTPTDQAKCVVITCATMIAVYLALNPYTLLQLESAAAQISFHPTTFAVEGAGWERLGPFSLRYGAGIWLSALAAAGFLFVLGEAAFVGRRKVAGLVLAGYPVALSSLLLFDRVVTPQLVAPIIPLLLLLSVRVSWAVAERFLNPALATALTVTLMFAGAVEPLTRTLQLDQLLARPDTRTLAHRWLLEHAPSGSPIALRQRFPYTRPEPIAGLRYFDLERLVVLETLRAQHDSFYVIVDEFPPLPQFSAAVPGWLQRFLAEHGKIAVTFDPRAAANSEVEAASVPVDVWEGAVYDGAERNFVPLAGFEAVTHAGPRLTIYSIAGEAKERS